MAIAILWSLCSIRWLLAQNKSGAQNYHFVSICLQQVLLLRGLQVLGLPRLFWYGI
jgi:hypothetical protein